jgi:hypothetical protein
MHHIAHKLQTGGKELRICSYLTKNFRQLPYGERIDSIQDFRTADGHVHNMGASGLVNNIPVCNGGYFLPSSSVM